jgi:hypothetical protein
MHILFFTLTCSGIVWGAHSLHLSEPSSEAPPPSYWIEKKLEGDMAKKAAKAATGVFVEDGTVLDYEASSDDEVIITIPDSHLKIHGGKYSTEELQVQYLNALKKELVGDDSLKINCDWDPDCEEASYTMAGDDTLLNVLEITEKTMSDNVLGDFVETGVWRGGISIFARALQVLHNQSDSRRVYACDSYEGMPIATTEEDSNSYQFYRYMEVSVDQVSANFNRFGLLDNTVRFVKGYFIQSLPVLRTHFQHEGRNISILRADGDMFESYYDTLYNLYEFVPVGGYFICDDCGRIEAAEKAVLNFRQRHGITEDMVPVNAEVAHRGVKYWRKEKAVSVDYAYYLEWNSTRKPQPDPENKDQIIADLESSGLA